MFRLLRLLLAALLLLAIAAIVCIWYVEQRGMSARARPSRFEEAVALQLRHLSIPSSDRDKRNTVPASADTIRGGMEHFADHCAVCHSNDGSGDTAFGHGLYPKPPDLRLERTQSLSDGEIFSIIQNGVRFTGMPSFGGPGAGDHDAAGEDHAGEAHSDEDTWKLVLFIRHLPKLSDRELSEMKKINPRGPAEREEDRKVDDFLNGRTPPGGHAHGGDHDH